MLVSMILLHGFNLVTGNISYNLSQRAVEDGKIPNSDLAKEVFPYARAAVYLWGLINIIMLAISYKWLGITRIYLYNMILMHFIEMFLPLDISAEILNLLKLVSLVTQFMVGYFNFWVDTLLVMLVPVMNLASRNLFHNEPIEQSSIVATILTMLMLGVFCWLMHLCITQVGMYYVQAEILRIGNE